MPSQLPLVGVKVLDATSNIAGPWGGAILANYGVGMARCISEIQHLAMKISQELLG